MLHRTVKANKNEKQEFFQTCQFQNQEVVLFEDILGLKSTKDSISGQEYLQ